MTSCNTIADATSEDIQEQQIVIKVRVISTERPLDKNGIQSVASI
jgi:hypothetical protein